ncbi:cationic amino acid transporter 2-like isoform X3 [Biomphalaria glabrata]|uniref:Cationic amino acid transporter 2-like isoform X2 n=1 Tax=Biomphalaria glabrata TaxID=6526 RepID=A0A9W2YMS8_BIOGL|nr:cationic amino acid transporter 2-like isoform X2 [Biomphalaria glabrata]XP_055864012.1 cationic amino acid transporter 2-like isoform X3 [Biomphalaria glabrata]
MGVLQCVTRKRPLGKSVPSAQNDAGKGVEMEKCLTTLDLVSLGVGSCCGAGMYLTAGIIAAQKAGPGGILSIVLAGLGSVLTGVHYAELAGICPHTSGSAYMYTYVTVGELSAFVIGWGLIVEYVIGTAAASVALSETFHSITEHTISNFIHTCTSAVGLPSIDVIAALVCLLLMWLLATGVKMSARFNNILNCINFIIWAIFVGASLYLGSSSNWSEHGGFLPFGPLGVLSAIPTAFYAFIGFDGLSTTGAECISPIKSIPVSIVLSIFINIVIFVMVVMGLTFSLPYNSLPADTAMLDVFAIIGYPVLKYFMAVGAVSGLFAATFGSLFPLPRVLQAMAQDGLIFRYFATVCPKRHTALRATIVSGLVAAFLAAFINLSLLIELVLIGTLVAYVIVTYSTLIVRYVDLQTGRSNQQSSVSHPIPLNLLSVREGVNGVGLKRKASDTNINSSDMKDCENHTNVSRQSSSHSDSCIMVYENGVVNSGFHDGETHCTRRDSSSSLSKRHDETGDLQENTYVFKVGPEKGSQSSPYNSPVIKPTAVKKKKCLSDLCCVTVYLGQNMYIYLLLMYITLFLISGTLSNCYSQLEKRNLAVIIILILLTVMFTVMAVILMFIPQVKRSREGFHAPLVPLTTVFTAGINIYLMTSLHWMTWILFSLWMTIGLLIYIFYGTM